MRRVGARLTSRVWMVAAAALMLSLGGCETLDHDRGSSSCYCYSDLGGSPATVGHKWKL